jgi:hypothetical protein
MKYIILIGAALLVSACGESRQTGAISSHDVGVEGCLHSACGESRQTGAISSHGVGVEGCSHSFREVPNGYVGKEGQMDTFSNIEFAVNYDDVDAALGLAKEDKKSASLQVVGTLYTKDGTPVERAGNIIYYYKDGIYQDTQNYLPQEVDKDEFIEAFGAYPKVSCKVVGM